MIKISEVQIVPVKPNNGLVAFVSFVLDDSFFVGDVAIYSRIDQQGYRLVYPAKTLFNGLKINCFKPINKPVADEIETQVFGAFEKLIDKAKKTEGTSYDRQE